MYKYPVNAPNDKTTTTTIFNFLKWGIDRTDVKTKKLYPHQTKIITRIGIGY